MKLSLLAATILMLMSTLHATPAHAQPYEVASPDGTLAVVVTLENGAPSYRVTRFGRDVVRPSRLGFILRDQAPLARDFRVVDEQRRSFDETWTQPWGEKKDIRNHYNELRLALQQQDVQARHMDLLFRVFDDGVGFRYEIPEQPNLSAFEILDELTEFALVGDPTTWWIGAYQGNRYEFVYQETPLSEVDTVHTPVTFRTEDDVYLSLHEAALTDYSSMTLARTGATTLEADLVPWSDGTKVKAAAPMQTPWRTLQVGDTAGDLMTSYLVLNLNEPSRIEDTSWIEPGKYVGIWWEMHLGTSTWEIGPRHGATTANTKRYIDFAAEHGFDGVLVEGWNRGWEEGWGDIGLSDHFSFTEPYEDFDLEGLAEYARERGVRLIGHHETGAGVESYERQMEDAYALYERLGVRAVKTGYVGHGQTISRLDEEGQEQREWHHGQHMVLHYRRAVEAAARHHIMLNVHEPIKATGIRRTWPNMMTREGARGGEYDAWGGGNPPEHTTILPFTRLLGGPMDYTPGIFDLTFEELQPASRVKTTLAKQLALYVVLYSPLHMAADLPENYEARPDAFQFIEDVPVDWEDTQVLHAAIGDYVTVVRQERGTDDWYLGSVTDEHGRKLRAPLSFLPAGRTYVAEIYRDADEADWETNPHAYTIEHVLVDASTVLPLRLAAGGGQAVRLRPATADDERQLSWLER